MIALLPALIALANRSNFVSAAPDAKLTVELKPLFSVPKTLYGIFFEEINHAGDGGLYAEMVRNPSFEDGALPRFWESAPNSAKGSYQVIRRASEGGKHPGGHAALSVDVQTAPYGVENIGYDGIGVKSGSVYRAALSIKPSGGLTEFRVALQSADGRVYAQAFPFAPGGKWSRLVCDLRSTATDAHARLAVYFSGAGSYELTNVSLMPVRKWHDLPFRADLANLIAALHPGFMRFPGGNWVEGNVASQAYRWKKTIGNRWDRQDNYDMWGYYSTNGLGYLEFLELCEQMRAEPLFVVNCGMTLRSRIPLAQVGPYVQDAVDAVQYANGSIESKWGAVRAADGHPKPFHLRYIEIGNENGGPAYSARYALIWNALHSRYPYLHLIADNWGGLPRSAPVMIEDEHLYTSPAEFFRRAGWFDRYSRTGPKVFAGEYAATNDVGYGDLLGAVGEAAYMTGLERNSDVVRLSSYAPLFGKEGEMQWHPDLIYFDNLHAFGTPSYWVQSLFSNHRPDVEIPIHISAAHPRKDVFPTGAVALGTWNTQAEFRHLTVVDGSGKTLFSDPSGSSLTSRSGSWTQGSALSQTSGTMPSLAQTAGKFSGSYTVRVEARKTSGAEGFLLSIGRAGHGDWVWWNVGGWGDTQDGVERSIDGSKFTVSLKPAYREVHTGKWYRLKMVVQPSRLRCYLDGSLVQDVALGDVSPTLFACAGTSNHGNTVIVKVVNGASTAKSVQLNLPGWASGASAGTLTTLTGLSATATNDFAHPNLVAPRTKRILWRKGALLDLPAYSVSVVTLRRK